MSSLHLLLAVFGLLVVVGLVMVLSASSTASYQMGGSSYAVFDRMLVYVAIGLVLFWIAVRTPLSVVRQASFPLLLVSMGLLVLVLTPLGVGRYGAHRWLTMGPVVFEPVEVAKLALTLWGAHVLVVKRRLLHRWRHLLVPVVPAALIIFALVMLQPDLGTTTTLGIILLALLWFVGAPKKLFAAFALGAVAATLVLAIGASYRLARVTSFLTPGAAPQAAGYQAHQAQLAMADGGVFGTGLGQGTAKWSYLPNAYNDFIFAVIGEELGLIGALVVVGLYATLAYVGLRIAARNTDPWNRLVAATLTTWLVAQAVINIGYVVGLLPVTGLPLPLVSSGGTSVIVTMVVFGILANCARHEPEAVAALHRADVGRLHRLFGLPEPGARRRRRGSPHRGTAAARGRSRPRSRTR